VEQLCQANKKRRGFQVSKKRGLDKWFGSENWVDISAPKEGGGFEPCGRKSAKDSDRGYPKCVPSDKARSMSKKEISSAVSRKRNKKQGVGGKPTNVKTFAKDGGKIMKSKMSTKGGMKGGMMKTKGYAKGGASKGGMMKTKGYAKGGAPKGGMMKTKGYAKGGASKGGASNFRKPSSQKTGLYGSR